MDLKIEEQPQLIQSLHSLLFPAYQPGCDSQAFLDQFSPFIEVLQRFDLAGEENQQAQIIVLKIISMFNYCFTQCPRKQLMIMLMEVIGKCRGNLKNLAVGRQKIRCSKWEKPETKTQSPILKLYAISDKFLRQIIDRIYLKNRRIPHLELTMFGCEGLLQAKDKFESFLAGEQAHLTQEQHHYLALIAAATMGCKYMWNREASLFLEVGGNLSWIEQGISAAPPFMQKMSKLSADLAFNLKGFMQSNCFSHCEGNYDTQHMLEALIVLAYYQCLSCLSLTMGLACQSEVNLKYLPKAYLNIPSQKSFEIVRLYQNIEAEKEKQIAHEMSSLLQSFEEDQESLNLLELMKSAKNFEDKKALKYKKIKKLQTARQFDEEQLQDQLRGLKYIQELKRTFSKFVDLQPLAAIHKANRPHQKDLILASEWEWELQGLKQVESVLGSKVRGALGELVTRLKVLGNQADRRITHFYQFSNNYVHQFIGYDNLVKQLSPVERAYLKLITKTPFLFSEETFHHMEQELKQREIPALNFALEAIGCKLELSIILITYLLDRGYDEQ